MKRAFTLVELIVVVAIVLLLAAILLPVISSHHGENAPRSSCQSNLKQIGLGFAQYVQDYDDKFPSARVTASTGWADVIQPYVKSTQIFQCPSAQNSAPPLTDYYYNRRAARVTLDKFESVSQNILTGEGDDDAPTWVSLAQMPASWKIDQKSPAWRHLEGANYGFADGHVKWLKPSRINSKFSDKGIRLSLWLHHETRFYSRRTGCRRGYPRYHSGLFVACFVQTKLDYGYSRSSCQSNLKIIGLGLMQYSMDYNGFLSVTSTGALASSGWSDVTYPYIKNWGVFQCGARNARDSSAQPND